MIFQSFKEGILCPLNTTFGFRKSGTETKVPYVRPPNIDFRPPKVGFNQPPKCNLRLPKVRDRDESPALSAAELLTFGRRKLVLSLPPKPKVRLPKERNRNESPLCSAAEH